MRYILVTLILGLILTLNAYEFEVRSFSQDDTDLKNAVGTTVNDMNDDPCAVIRIETDIKADIFLAGSDVVKREKTAPGEYYFFISFRSTWVKFTAEGYEPYTWQIPVILKPKMTYLLQLTTLGGVQGDLIPIVIIADPPDAKILLNDQEIQSGIPQSIEKSQYSVKLVKEGYQSISDSILVSEENKSFLYRLKPLDPGHIDIATEPDSVKIFVDGIEKGISPIVLDLAYGFHRMELKKMGYFPVLDSFFVESGRSYQKSFKLEKNAGTIRPNIIPNDAVLTVNGEIFEHKKPILLNPGIYRFEVKRDSYRSYEELITIELDQVRDLNIELIPIKGRLNITVNPGKTDCYLYDSKMLINAWKGSRSFQSILSGDYTLVCKADGYQTDSVKVRINPNQLTEKDVTLEKILFDSRAYGKGQLFDEARNYPFFTMLTDNSVSMNQGDYDQQFYAYSNNRFYVKIIKALYIGANYQYNFSQTEQDLGLETIHEKSDDDDDDGVNSIVLKDDDQRFSAHALFMLPYRFQPFIWYSQQFENQYDNIKNGIEYTGGMKYFSHDIFLLAARNENKSFVQHFEDLDINPLDRIQFYYESAEYYRNWFRVMYLRERINPLYVTFYSHNHDYFYNAAALAGDFNLKFEMTESHYKNINNEDSGIDKDIRLMKADADLFLFSFLSVNGQYKKIEQTTIFNGLLFNDNSSSYQDINAETRLHLIQTVPFNLFAGVQYQQHKWQETPENISENYLDYSKFNATAGLMMRSTGVYQNLSILLNGSYLIKSPEIEEKTINLSAFISACF
jgi:hypothetical protein